MANFLQNFAELVSEGAGRCRTIDRPSPQVAKRAGERALGAGKKNCERPFDSPARSTLRLE